MPRSIPTFVLILADDLDLAKVNNIETPAIDRLAAEGLVFSNAMMQAPARIPGR
jgi:arylsulfatase A-like enzyme